MDKDWDDVTEEQELAETRRYVRDLNGSLRVGRTKKKFTYPNILADNMAMAKAEAEANLIDLSDKLSI